VTELAQYVFDGAALGAVYALVAVGFAIVYRASKLINFANGALLLVGAYVVSWLAAYENIPFGLAVIMGVATIALGAACIEAVTLRRVAGHDVFAGVMVTIGVSVVLTSAVAVVFGDSPRVLGDPWGSSATHLAGVTITWVKASAIGSAIVLLGLFAAFDRCSRYGVAMRALAADQEAAIAAGVPQGRVLALTWAMAGVAATIAGIFLSGYPNSPNISLGDVGLRAFPALILGGLESVGGAVIGGITIGLVEVLTAGYAPSWLGAGFYTVAPYGVMMIVLLVRPYGLFGTRPVERV
jgi:branched-chain amino acid transport system permease protein